MWLLIAIAAYAAPCDAPARAGDLDDALVAAERAFVGMDSAAFEIARATVQVTLTCQTDAVAVLDVAALHRVEAYRAFLDGDLAGAKLGFAALRAADPGFGLPIDVAPPAHPLRAAFDGSLAISKGRVPIDPPVTGWVQVDGRPAASVPGHRPYVWQRFGDDGAVVETSYLPKGSLPVYPRIPPPPPPGWWDAPRHRSGVVLVSAGVSLAAIGGALAASAAWGSNRWEPVLSPWAAEEYWARQLAGRYWTGVGLGVGGASMVVGGTLGGLPWGRGDG
jgi:hypothetical protein